MTSAPIKTGLLAAALATTALLVFASSAQAHPAGYRYGWHYGWHKGWHRVGYAPVYVATPVVYAQPWVWTADGWRYAPAAAPAGLFGIGLLGF